MVWWQEQKLRAHSKHKDKRTNWKWWASLSSQKTQLHGRSSSNKAISPKPPQAAPPMGIKCSNTWANMGHFHSNHNIWFVLMASLNPTSKSSFLFSHVTSFRKPACTFYLEVSTSFPRLVLTACLLVSLCFVLSILWCYGLNLSLSNSYVELGVVVNVPDSSSKEAKAWGWQVQDYLGLCSRALS